MAIPLVPAAAARRLLLGTQGLLDDPARPASLAQLRSLVERLGFVQIDSINVVARAQHLTLHSRLHGYRPEHLDALLERERFLFEHWTHDASAVPTAWYAQWRPRFRRAAARIRRSAWWKGRLGPRPRKLLNDVLARVRQGGEARAQDFEDRRASGRSGWWEWTPQKAALEYLWHTGELAVARRVTFQKVYDLPGRVLPEAHARPEPSRAEHLEWACRTALERLGVATPVQIARYWAAVSSTDARRWCAAEARAGRLLAVRIGAHEERPDEASQPAYAPIDWEDRLAALPEPPDAMRLLCPFDPVLRDRARALRLFGFDYRFEAFVPAAKREHGYYVLPILEGERLVGRVDPKLHRDRGTLAIRRVSWEPGVGATRTRRKRLEETAWALARWLGAERLEW